MFQMCEVCLSDFGWVFCGACRFCKELRDTAASIDVALIGVCYFECNFRKILKKPYILFTIDILSYILCADKAERHTKGPSARGPFASPRLLLRGVKQHRRSETTQTQCRSFAKTIDDPF